jgi:hypothetical protein
MRAGQNMNDVTQLVASYAAGCTHAPKCPPYGAPDHDAAVVVAEHHDQGWIKLCNGVVVFDDTGELVGSVVVAAHRPEPAHRANPNGAAA